MLNACGYERRRLQPDPHPPAAGIPRDPFRSEVSSVQRIDEGDVGRRNPGMVTGLRLSYEVASASACRARVTAARHVGAAGGVPEPSASVARLARVMTTMRPLRAAMARPLAIPWK